MKYLILLLLPFSCFAQTHTNDSIYGQVSSYRETIALLNPSKETISTDDVFLDPYDLTILGDQEKKPEHVSNRWYYARHDRLINYYREYDKKGRMIKEKWEDVLYDLQSVFKYSYDTINHITEIKELDGDGKSDATERRSYNYKGQLVAKLTDYIDFYSYTYYEYNDKNQCIKKGYFGKNGKEGETLYEYENGKIKRLKTVSNIHILRLPSGGRTTIIGEWTERLIEEYFYDERGNLIKTCNYSNVISADATEPSCNTYTYDHNGNKTATYVNDGELRSKITYYKNGKTKKTQNFVDGLETSYMEYYFQGDLLRKVIHHNHNEKKHVVEFDYTFDDNHNWIQQIKTVDGKPLYIRSRIIYYYKPFDFFPGDN